MTNLDVIKIYARLDTIISLLRALLNGGVDPEAVAIIDAFCKDRNASSSPLESVQ